MGVDFREKVMAYISTKGPILPAQIAKMMNVNSMLAGAMLSELVEKGQLKMSHLKVGGSPLYYARGQEPDLLKFTEYLNEKDRETVELLKERKVIRDVEAGPLIRTTLRSVPDFAVPLNVTYNQQQEVFWKWFLLTEDETKFAIRSLLQPESFVQPEEPLAPVRPEPPVQLPARPAPAPRPVEQPRPPPAPRPVRNVEPVAPQQVDDAAEPRKEIQCALLGSSDQGKPVDRGDPATDPFLSALLAFFSQNNIKILEQHCLKKKGEFDFVLSLQSPVGELIYYCKAKSKKKISDADVSAAFVQGQLRKLPVIFLSPGELAKKAEELVRRDLHGLTYKRVEGLP